MLLIFRYLKSVLLGHVSSRIGIADNLISVKFYRLGDITILTVMIEQKCVRKQNVRI